MFFEFREARAQLQYFVFRAQDARRGFLHFVAQLFRSAGALQNFRHQNIELVSRQLRFQMTQLVRDLFVATRLAGLTLEGANLPLHFANQILDAQKILLGVFQFAQRFLFLRLELGDARRFLKHEPPVIRFAGKNLRDVSLGHDRVARLAHTSSHEELLNVLQPAHGLVDKILAPAITKNSARDRYFVVSQLDSRGPKMFFVHATNG